MTSYDGSPPLLTPTQRRDPSKDVVSLWDEHEQGCPMNWPTEPDKPRRACWCYLPEDYELPDDGEEG